MCVPSHGVLTHIMIVPRSRFMLPFTAYRNGPRSARRACPFFPFANDGASVTVGSDFPPATFACVDPSNGTYRSTLGSSAETGPAKEATSKKLVKTNRRGRIIARLLVYSEAKEING